MKEEKVNISIEKDIYDEASSLYHDLGLDLETAVRAFLLASLREDGLPFMLRFDGDSSFDHCYCDDCYCDCYCDCDCDCNCENCDCENCDCEDCKCDEKK